MIFRVMAWLRLVCFDFSLAMLFLCKPCLCQSRGCCAVGVSLDVCGQVCRSWCLQSLGQHHVVFMCFFAGPIDGL